MFVINSMFKNRIRNLSVDLTCVDELDMSLQVAVNHENLVAARMRTGSLSHLLMMLLDVLLKNPPNKKTVYLYNQSESILKFTKGLRY